MVKLRYAARRDPAGATTDGHAIRVRNGLIEEVLGNGGEVLRVYELSEEGVDGPIDDGGRRVIVLG